MSHIGIDISLSAIHVTEIMHENGRLTLGTYGAVQLSAPVNYAEPLASNQELVDALKRIKKEYNLSLVEVSIPEEEAYIFTTDIPEGNEESIRTYIEMHLEENVPITLSDAVYDYHIIEHAQKGEVVHMSIENETTTTATDHAHDISETADAELQSQSGEVALAEQKDDAENKAEDDSSPATLPSLSTSTAGTGAFQGPTFFASVSVVPQTLIDQYIEIFEMAGMTPVSFLVENQALSKSIIKMGDLSTTLIVHVEDRKTVLSVVSNGSVHFTSTVKIGSEDFTAAIMKEYNVSREEAIRMKTEKGQLKNENQGTLFMSLLNTASALKDEIDRIAMYWQSYIAKHNKGQGGHKIERIVLSGRDALINGFKEYLVATVRLPVETANVWTNIYDLDKNIPDINYIDSLDYAVAIGLAMPKLNR